MRTQQEEMVITIEQKLSEFESLIEDKVRASNRLLISQKQQKLEQAHTKAQEQVEARYAQNRKQAIDRLEKQKTEQLSTLTQQARKKQLALMEGFLNQSILTVEDKLKTFTLSAEYPAFVRKMLLHVLQHAEAGKEEPVVVRIPPQQFAKTQAQIMALVQEEGYTALSVEEAEMAMLGGCTVEFVQRGTRINKSFQYAMEQQRDRIGEYIQSYIQGGDQWTNRMQ